MSWIISIIVFALCFLVWASSYIGSGIYVKALCKGWKEGEVALTFDDGPCERTAEVLDLLKLYDVKATFFLVGNKVEKYPEIVRRIAGEGHAIGCHTYSHSPTFPLFSVKKMELELNRTKNAIFEVTGKKVRLFRPPFGVTNPNIAKAVKRGGYIVAGWSFRSFDTVREMTSDGIVSRLEKRLRGGGEVILLHDRVRRTAQLTERVISIARSNGMKFVTFDEMFEIESYETGNPHRHSSDSEKI